MFPRKGGDFGYHMGGEEKNLNKLSCLKIMVLFEQYVKQYLGPREGLKVKHCLYEGSHAHLNFESQVRPVVRKVDIKNAIQWIEWLVLIALIHWGAIYPVDSAIQPDLESSWKVHWGEKLNYKSCYKSGAKEISKPPIFGS